MVNDEVFIDVCNNSNSVAEAARILNMPFTTFSRRAKHLKCYATNQAGRGLSKNKPSISVQDILNGLHPNFQSYKLKNKLIKENVIEYKCNDCGLNEQNGRSLKLELHHIDGDSTNHKLENLKLLCPNCHSQTTNYRGKNKLINKDCQISDKYFELILKESKNIRQALIKLNLAPCGDNYRRAKKLLTKIR